MEGVLNAAQRQTAGRYRTTMGTMAFPLGTTGREDTVAIVYSASPHPVLRKKGRKLSQHKILKGTRVEEEEINGECFWMAYEHEQSSNHGWLNL